MHVHGSRIIIRVAIATAVVAVAAVAYAAIVTFRQDAVGDYIGLQGGPALLTARTLTTPVGETTGLWHYHPGHVYNVVTQGTITIEDGCGQVNQYSAGQGFETSEGRVHRAYNLGSVDAQEYNMFVGPPNRPIGVNIPGNEHRCGPPSAVEECQNGGWATFNHPAPFGSQGACVAYVNHRRRITLLVPEDPEDPAQKLSGACLVDPPSPKPGATWLPTLDCLGWVPPDHPLARRPQ